MRLIKQTELIYTLGSRQKVYEIDLCEVGPGAYVVNFRYGRLGATLKDGSKTPIPVPLERAEFIYEALRNTQLAKGYVPKGQGGAPSVTPAQPRASRAAPARPAAPSRPAPSAPQREIPPRARGEDADERVEAILKRLRLGDVTPHRSRQGRRRQRGYGEASTWSLDRAIWRAGELKIRRAAPLIVTYLGDDKNMRDYVCLSALALIGEAAVIPDVEAVYANPRTLDHVRRVAGEALRLLYGPRQLEGFIQAELEALPGVIKRAHDAGDAAALLSAARQACEGKNATHAEVLRRLYLIDDALTRPAVLALAEALPLEPGAFKGLRGLLKSAELRRDGQLFGLLAHRFELTRAMFKKPSWGNYAWINGKRVDVSPQAMSGAHPKAAYSSATRTYLRRRTWRTLQRLGDEGDLDYINMAVGYLLRFKDQDAYGGINREGSNLLQPFLRFWAYNNILYRHSTRLMRDRTHLRYYLKPQPRPQRADRRRGRRGRRRHEAPQEQPQRPQIGREGAYPHLWQRRPQGLIHLLMESECAAVHDFAVRNVRALDGFVARLDARLAARLLSAPYAVTNQLGLERAEALFDFDAPDTALALAAVHSPLKAAQDQARRWINTARAHFTADGAFIADLLSGPQAESRRFGRAYIQERPLDDAVAQAVVAHLIARMPDEAQPAVVRDIVTALRRLFAPQLRTLSEALILDLLSREDEQAHRLAGEILIARAKHGEETPEASLIALLDSQFSEVRATGMALMAEMPDEVINGYRELIVALSIHSEATLRGGARLVIQRVARDPSKAEGLAVDLVRALLQQKLPDGAGAHLVVVLSEDLRSIMDGVPKSVIMRLLRSSRGPAQELGGLLLPTALRPDQLSVDEIARLGTHEIASVRRAAWAMYEADVERLKAMITHAVRLIDSDWEDTRQFAFGFFGGAQFGPEDFPPNILVSLCDSTREDVQRFGQGLLNRFFTEAFGPEYMLKLSEHPSAGMQLFVTNYLERYAAGSPERLEQLKLYFIAALSRVNRGGLTKQRVLRFFAEEAKASRESAEVIAEILTRQSATIAIGDRAAAIEIMLQIHRDWPDVSLPIKVRTAEVRGGVSI